MRVHGLKSSSTPPALKVPVGPLPAQRCNGGKMDVEKLVTDAPPQGKEYHTPEMYYKTVLKGAGTIVGECSKDVIFE